MIPRLLRLSFAGFLLLFLVTVASAQTAVVIRRVDLRPDANSTRRAIRVLSVDENVQLIGPYLTNGYFHVRTGKNEEGWVWGRNVEVEGALVDTLPGPGAIPQSRPPWAPAPAPATNPTPAPNQVTSLPVENSAVSNEPPSQTAQTETNRTPSDCGGEFELVVMRDGFFPRDKTPASSLGYRTVGGTRMEVVSGRFKSPQGALDEIHQFAADGTKPDSGLKVIQNGPKLDDMGNIVGERLVFLRDEKGGSRPTFGVAWTWGPNFHEITSVCKD
jgi:hypothetical protein